MKQNLIIIDDDLPFRNRLAHSMIKKGFEVEAFGSSKEAKEGTIRKKFGISIDKNSVHGSDSVDNAKIEINFFFKD